MQTGIFNYLIKEPKVVKEQNPLIILIHGYGSNEEDLFSFAPELPDDYYVVSVQAPYQVHLTDLLGMLLLLMPI